MNFDLWCTFGSRSVYNEPDDKVKNEYVEKDSITVNRIFESRVILTHLCRCGKIVK